MRPKVLIAGSIGIDSVVTPFGSARNEIGGSATFSSLACALFTKPALLSIIGSDYPKRKLLLFEEKGIDTSAIQQSQKPTMRWVAHYDADINLAHTDSFSANALEDFDPKVSTSLANTPALLVGVLQTWQQLKMLDSFSTIPKIIVSDTIGLSIKKHPADVKEVVRKSTIGLMNDSEARMLFNTTNLVLAARQLLSLGSKYAIIKKGEHGCLLFSKNSHFSCPGYPLENIKDPTGCGDSFAGALVGYLASTEDLSEKNMRKAIVYASAVASFNAESFSFYRLAQITKKDVKQRVKEFKDFVKF